MTPWEGGEAAPTARNPRLGMLGGIKSRKLWVVAGVAAVAAGLALNWGWLTAVGAAPIILAALPCAAMCAWGSAWACRGTARPRSVVAETASRPRIAKRRRLTASNRDPKAGHGPDCNQGDRPC